MLLDEGGVVASLCVLQCPPPVVFVAVAGEKNVLKNQKPKAGTIESETKAG